ncbi:ASCH domain protein [uncultured archaeon]|nr:ASCH domain protein [uncultured archaeon]
MKIQMHLHNEPFEKVKKGLKVVEGRVLDKKRKEILKGNELVFINRKDEEKVFVIVTKIEKFKSFTQMCDKIKSEDLGYKSKEEFLTELKRFYSKEDEKEGVIAISFKLK